jgi:hypothetical protein
MLRLCIGDEQVAIDLIEIPSVKQLIDCMRGLGRCHL